MFNRIIGAVAAIVGLCAAPTTIVRAAVSQVPQVWTTNVVAGEFPSEQAALSAVRAQGGVYALAERVQRIEQSGSSTIYVYGAIPRPPVIGNWTYTMQHAQSNPHASLEAAIDSVKAAFDANGKDCPLKTIVEPRAGWHESGLWYSGDSWQETRQYDAQISIPPSCPRGWIPAQVLRERVVKCPEYMDWDHDQKACTRKAVAKLSTRPMFCQANDLQHNPCNVNTGDKYQSEIDFALPWISFVRHYHSSHSTANSALGPAWTHELAQQLYVSTSSYAALVKGNGDVLPFHEGEAVDGSGWRIAISNGKYEVVTPKTIFRFESNRLFQVEDVERGTLNLTYDGTGRLTRVRHTTGRSATFEYDNASQGGQGQLTGVRVEGVLLVGYAYDSDGRLVSAVYPDATFREYQYEDSRFPRHLTGIIDESGVRYGSYEYNVDGLVTVSKHADDTYRGEFTYQADGSTVFTDPNGRRQTFWFNSDGAYRKVSRIADPRGEESIRYAASGDDFRRRPVERVSRMGARSTYAYSLTADSALGQLLLTKTTEAAGTPDARISQEWVQVSSGRTTRSQRGNRSLDTRYNGRGQPVSFTESYTGSQDTRVTSIKYCEAADIGAGACPVLGLMMSIEGPRSDVADVTRFIYRDADEPGCGINLVCSYRKGDLWKTVNALGQYAEVLSYDFAGRVTAIRDINGVTSHFGFDLRGRPSAVTIAGPDGASNGEHSRTEIKYLPTGLISEVSRNDGESVAFAYDPAHRLISVGAAGDGVVEFVLDDAGNRLKEDGRDRFGNLVRTLSKTYDEFGRLQASSDASLNSTIHRYDSSGNLEGVTDALGRVFRLEHDPLERPIRTWSDLEGVAAETLYSYNEFDELSGVVDPKGLRTSYTYDGFGHLTGQVSPDTGSTKFATDTAGNLRTRTDARGIQTAYHYDALNRLIGIAYPDPNLDVGYTYDVAPEYCAADERFAKGRLGTVLYASGRTSYCYDRFGQVVRKTQLVDGVTTMLHFAYTNFGRLDAVTYPDGSVVDYVRDAQGHVREVGLSRLGKGRNVVVSEVTHAPFGPPTGWTYGNGRRLHRPFDLNYRPEAVHDASAGGLSIGFGYDAVGSITNLKNGVGTSILASYGYDALGRLTETRDGDTSVPIEAYTYDATGNRTSLTTASGTTSYIYPADSHHLVSVAGEVRIYNAAGNTVSIGAKEFEYNDANRMSAVKQAGVVVEKYSYNHRGERILREPLSGNAQVTLYDEAGQWIGNYDAAGHPLQQAIWLDNYPIALINAPSAGVPEVAYVQPDHLGTPRVVIDPIRDVAIWEWSSRGEVFGDEDPKLDPDEDGADFELALRFPGQQATAASGTFYNYQREYDSVVGRYTQSDPAGLLGGVNTYLYGSGAPTSRVDPEGLLDVWVWMPLPYEGGIPSYGKLHSSFGHVSSTAAGMDYSFGPGGNSASTSYVSSQLQLRTGIKHTLNMSPAKEAAVGACLAKDQGAYSALTNNCATPIQECLRQNGFRMPPNNMILPETFNHFMWWMFDDSSVVPRGK